ncbi:MAG: hypothetical protein ACFHWX_18660 [Bacteroidota bacterium]
MNSAQLNTNEPRILRLKQLNSLVSAFGLGRDLQKNFESGNFLENRKEQDFEYIIKDIEKYRLATEHENGRFNEMEREKLKEFGFKLIFQEQLRFLLAISNIMNFNLGWIQTGSISSRYLISKTNSILKTIDQEKLEEIKLLTCKMIDPKGHHFSISKLVTDFDYPDVDLETIDLEYL